MSPSRRHLILNQLGDVMVKEPSYATVPLKATTSVMVKEAHILQSSSPHYQQTHARCYLGYEGSILNVMARGMAYYEDTFFARQSSNWFYTVSLGWWNMPSSKYSLLSVSLSIPLN
jgi:hypothetical protein